MVHTTQIVTSYAAGKCYLARTGYSGLRACEKLNLSSSTWTPLPDMREARRCFNPCLFNEFFYICGYPSRIMEAFSPQTSQFLMPFTFLLPEESVCCLYEDGGSLVVHLHKSILVCEAGQGGQLIKRSEVPAVLEVGKRPNCQPVVDRSSGQFFIYQRICCHCFDMKTGKRIDSYK